ncbi:MAG: aminotransferase class I/II-fold pyridoxal phosphate-dependent enzyme, partial [Myxococcota bacterium]
YYPEGTIVSSGLSKWCGAGGWRLGTFTFPADMGWLRRAMAVVASETYTSTSAPIQYAAVRAFQSSPDLDNYLLHSRRVLSALGSWCAKTLNNAGLSTCTPDGGFYLFPCFDAQRDRLAARGIHGSAELCRRLLADTGVAILPGNDFGRPDSELSARIAYVNFDGAQALAASQARPEVGALDEDFVARWCPETVSAIQRLCDWIRA